MAKRLTPRQWHAAKARMQREGTWDENRYNSAKNKYQKTQKPEEEIEVDEPQPSTSEECGEYFSGPLSDYLDEFFKDNIKEIDHIESMYNVGAEISNLSIENQTNSSTSETGEVRETNCFNFQNAMEGQPQESRQVLRSHFPILHEGRNFPSTSWKTDQSYRCVQVSCGTYGLGRAAGVSGTQEYVRDKCLIMEPDCKPFEWGLIMNNHISQDFDELEGYFQNYNSLGIVIKCLPGDSYNIYDMYKQIIKYISDPFVLVCERSKANVLHFHMIWLTSKRSDNAKRSLQKILNPINPNFSICCQQTRSLKNLIKYILKEPIVLGIGNSDHFRFYCYHLMKANEVYVKPETVKHDSNNVMINDILNVMRSKFIYTYEELLRESPDVMIKYLHKPNLSAIVNNCKLFLLQPCDIKSILVRISKGNGGYPCQFFRLWCILEYQQVNPGDFILDLWNILCKLPSKKNVFSIHGASDAGKSAYIRPLFELCNFGEIVAGGQFMFQNCINKEILIWEEPIIGHDFVEMCKRVMEGVTTQVPVKFKEPQTLYRTPIFVTTNKDLWYFCTGDESALANRMIEYRFENYGPGINNKPFDWYYRCYLSYRKWCTELGRYLACCEPDASTGTEHNRTGGTSECSGSSEQLYSADQQGSEIHRHSEQRPRTKRQVMFIWVYIFCTISCNTYDAYIYL